MSKSRFLLFLIALTAPVMSLTGPCPLQAAPLPFQTAPLPLQNLIEEASARYEIPKDWIRAVIQAESQGNERAVSPKGALGLMQLMPKTWLDLQRKHALSSTPFEPRANILAGTAYLKEMYKLFGFPGLFSAYNAGPSRYNDHLLYGKALPDETENYTAQIVRFIGGDVQGPTFQKDTPSSDTLYAPLFVALSSDNKNIIVQPASNQTGFFSQESFRAHGQIAPPKNNESTALFVLRNESRGSSKNTKYQDNN